MDLEKNTLQFELAEDSKHYRHYLCGEILVYLLTMKKPYFTISTVAHLCCFDTQSEGINFILLIITITLITQLIFCGQISILGTAPCQDYEFSYGCICVTRPPPTLIKRDTILKEIKYLIISQTTHYEN